MNGTHIMVLILGVAALPAAVIALNDWLNFKRTERVMESSVREMERCLERSRLEALVRVLEEERRAGR